MATLHYNNVRSVYEGELDDDRIIVVQADTHTEAVRDAIKQGVPQDVYEDELWEPWTWENCVDNEYVWIEVNA